MTRESLTLPSPGRVLVFEAHSDDAVIGMGATMKKMTGLGVEVVLCTVTLGETQHAPGEKESIVETRKGEGRCADKVLGIQEHLFLTHGCQSVSNDIQTFQEFVGIIRRYKPDWIFTHSPDENHRDHRAIAALSEESWWKATEEDVLVELGPTHHASALFFYEVLPGFSARPDICIDVSDEWDAKMQAIACFKSQERTVRDFLGLVESRGRMRGYLVGATHAEAFMSSSFMPRRAF